MVRPASAIELITTGPRYTVLSCAQAQSAPLSELAPAPWLDIALRCRSGLDVQSFGLRGRSFYLTASRRDRVFHLPHAETGTEDAMADRVDQQVRGVVSGLRWIHRRSRQAANPRITLRRHRRVPRPVMLEVKSAPSLEPVGRTSNRRPVIGSPVDAPRRWTIPLFGTNHVSHPACSPAQAEVNIIPICVTAPHPAGRFAQHRSPEDYAGEGDPLGPAGCLRLGLHHEPRRQELGDDPQAQAPVNSVGDTREAETECSASRRRAGMISMLAAMPTAGLSSINATRVSSAMLQDDGVGVQ